MKAIPKKLVPGEGYVRCPTSEATHLTIRVPGPVGILTLPVMIEGTRAGTGNWTWNGDTEKPTLMPSLKTTMGRDGKIICHSWVNDGMVQFLDDSTHEFRGQTLPLLDVDLKDTHP